MKKLLLIMLLLVLPLTFMFSQCADINQYAMPTKKNWVEPTKKVTLYTLQLVTETFSQAQFNKGNLQLGYLSSLASLGTMFTYAYVIDLNKKNWYFDLITYSLFRFALYDVLYNGFNNYDFKEIYYRDPIDYEGLIIPRVIEIGFAIAIISKAERI
jgi:hypothetical protein